MIATNVQRRVHRIPTRTLIAKRVLDLVVTVVVLPVVIALMGVVALAIRLEGPGPIVFRQSRTGRAGRRFNMYKFRTMVPNAEELKASIMHLNILPAPDFKVPNDPRMTKVGRILRKTSLDELPQVLNVLRGEMSLVGPRPTSFSASTYELWHGQRLEVPPGITGLWQVKMRNESTFDERVRLDVKYLNSVSFLTDVKILGLTVMAMVKRTGN